MKTYRGCREGQAVAVTVNGRSLETRLDLLSHSPTGFEWAYGGSGPAQLALALLADHLRNDEEAVLLHQEFKAVVVARLPYRGWELTSKELDTWLEIVRPRSTTQP
jgi:Family of unknown function (DUF6166)